MPLAASLNFGADQSVPNHVVVRLSTPDDCANPDWLGTIAVYNRFGRVHVVLDMFGFFTAPTPPGSVDDDASAFPPSVQSMRRCRTAAAHLS